MQGVEEVAYTVGGALVSPGLGTTELVVGLLVACGFAVSAVQAAIRGERPHRSSHLSTD